METAERSVSGRSLVVVGLTITALVTAASLLFGPGLRNEVLQEQSPRTLREPIAAGTHDGQVWEAVGRFDGTANCVELRYRAEVLGRACDQGPDRAATPLPRNGPVVAYGTAPESSDSVELPLDSGDTLTAPVAAGELGFPVGFWAVELPPGESLAD